MRDIGSKLREYFKKRGLTQKQIAEQLGVAPTYVNKVFSNERGFSEKQAMKWETLFGLSHVFLMTGEGSIMAGEADERPVPAWMYNELMKERDEWRDKCQELEGEMADLIQRLSRYERVEKEAV